LGEYLKTPLETPYWVNWMQTPNQTQTPEKGGNQTQGTQGNTQAQVYSDLVAVVKKYVKLRHNDLKELSDLSLTIENFIEIVKKTMGQIWYDTHVDMTLRDLLIERLMWSGKAVFHCPEYVEIRKCVEERADEILDDVLHSPNYDDVIDFVLDLRNWGLENLTFMELETISTIINDIIDYCMRRGYGPDDSIDDCFMMGDDA